MISPSDAIGIRRIDGDHMQQQIRILRLPDTLAKTGDSRSTHYAKVKVGLMPPAVRLGARSVGWVQFEVDAVLAARIAGKTDDDVRKVVCDLVASRREATAP